MRALSGLWRLQIRAVASTNARRGACPGRMYRESGIINMHILVRKKPRVRASGPLRPGPPRGHPRPRSAIPPPSRRGDPTDDRSPHTVPQKHSLVQRNDQYSRKIPTKAPCQIGPATIRRYGRPNAAGRALSLGYVSRTVPLISPLYSVKSFDQNHSCIQIPAACKRRNMSTHSLYS